MFDDISFDYPDLAWTGLKKSEITEALKDGYNPLMARNAVEKENPGMREIYLMTKATEYMYFTGRILLNKEFSPIQCAVLHNLWHHSFPMLIASRGFGKSFLIAAYIVMRAALYQGTKAVCVGAGFRQSKIIHAYADEIFRNSSVLQSIFKGDKNGSKMGNDMITLTLGNSIIYFCPMGDGSRIRGLRANVVVADEMNSLDTNVYEVVVNNFASVSMEPIKAMQRYHKIKTLEAAGEDLPFELTEERFTNQSIIAGTMGFEHEPMYSYFNKYKKIIETKGGSMKEVLTGIDSDISYKDFCILRVPYELIPRGYMDDKTIARARATIHIGAYNSEYGCVPVKDTTGFFRRSIIDQCVANDGAVSENGWPSYCPTSFDAVCSGNSDKTYVIGIDPAADEDNFAVTVLEVHPMHQRVVYCWTTNREEVKKIDPGANYYGYCARHVRDLIIAFRCENVAIDGQGGGRAICEALHDPAILGQGSTLYWPVIEDGKPQDTDMMTGEHILNIIQFANYNWVSTANHALRKDLETRNILFPRYSSIILGLASESPEGSPLEDCIYNIEELKTELSTIVMTSTATRSRWDTPQIKTDTNRVGRMRKDRYSALLMANDLARKINRELIADREAYETGGRVGDIKLGLDDEGSPFYIGNSALSSKLGPLNYGVVYR